MEKRGRQAAKKSIFRRTPRTAVKPFKTGTWINIVSRDPLGKSSETIAGIDASEDASFRGLVSCETVELCLGREGFLKIVTRIVSRVVSRETTPFFRLNIVSRETIRQNNLALRALGGSAI